MRREEKEGRSRMAKVSSFPQIISAEAGSDSLCLVVPAHGTLWQKDCLEWQALADVAQLTKHCPRVHKALGLSPALHEPAHNGTCL